MGRLYVGVNGTAREVSKLYIGVSGVARKVEKLYVGVNGTARLVFGKDLEGTSWSEISSISRSGLAANYWSVGDTKSVEISGTIGTYAVNTTLWVYIIGINHRNVNGVTWQGFKTAKTGGVNVCMTDSGYGNQYYDGTKYFNMNHWGTNSGTYNTSYGGWKGCDLRYDILGSTSTPPSGYGTKATEDRAGYDASSTTPTSPVNNTLMAALPNALRAVMQPMTIYTDNAGNYDNIEANVTTSVDYLPLLAEYEISGVQNSANQYEQNYQTQYAYYANGNSKVKYRDSAPTTAAYWWTRSPSCDFQFPTHSFSAIGENGGLTMYQSRKDLGLAPVFQT